MKNLIRTLVGVTCAASLLLGCNQPQTAKTKTPQKTEKTEKAKSVGTTPTTPKTEASATACADYSKKFCEVAGGEKSQACQSIKVVSDLMPAAACTAGLADLAYTKTKVAEMGKKCGILMEKLCKDLGPDSKSCGMVKQMTPTFPPERCAMMMAQYDQVLKELQAQENMNKPLPADKAAMIAADDAPSFGPKNAKVTIVEFSDFECPYCTRAATVTTEIKKKYKDKVRVVFRNFPLSFHKNAHLAHQASLAAHKQGKFWEMHDLLFQNQKALTRPDLEKYAKQLKLDVTKFKAALDSKAHAAKVDSDIKMGGEVYVSGTPTMFLNGERISNPTDFATVAAAIEAKLK